ncbi:MAG: carbon-nitrogen hydrolase family protein [Candidatus Levyibacteriota bacterium]
MKFNVALLQILPNGSDQNKNLEKGIEYCKKAKELGVDLVLFPEIWNTGYEDGTAIDQQSNFFQSFVKLAKDLSINIAITYLEKNSPKPKNSVSIINKNGEVVLDYSKVFICNFQEGTDRNCSPGNEFSVCKINGAQGEVEIGAMICADREFPEAATQLMLKGAELIVVPNSCTWDEIRKDILKVRAFENLVGIAMANYPSPKNNGQSSAYHPIAWDENGKSQSTKIIQADEKEGIFLASFDMDEIRKFRVKEKWRLDYRKKNNP